MSKPPSSTLILLSSHLATKPPQSSQRKMAGTKCEDSTTKARASPELGTDDFAISRNPRTGRPLRKSMARKTDSPFVDSAIAISDGSDEEESIDANGEGIVCKQKKRKRSPSPALTDLECSEVDQASDISDIDMPCDHSPTAVSSMAPLQLTLNVPAGPDRQITLNIDLANLTGRRMPRLPPSTTSRKTARRNVSIASPSPKQMKLEDDLATSPPKTRRGKSHKAKAKPPKVNRPAGFLDLPAELRNEIYRMVFVAPARLDFGNPGQHFQRSAALLRACRQTYDEGRDILYAENEFFFQRRSKRHGSFWNDDWSELGFKPVRHFLKMIGTVNTASIRHVTLLFEDAAPSLNPNLHTAEERRFIGDEILHSVLRHLGRHARLQKIHMNFQGRKTLDVYFPADHFLEILTRIRADEVQFVKHPIWGNYGSYHARSKQTNSVEKMCIGSMVRKKKIYAIEM